MISFREVEKKYGENTAVEAINIEVNRGELFGLIGPDGSGKSTLFRMLTTLVLPDAGSIYVNGKDVIKEYKYIRKHVGYMPGTFSLYPDLTVAENLHFFATLYGTTVDENYDLIKDIYQQIEPFKTRRANDLSGGMKQKLALSCALIHRPLVLVLDEPTTGVDAVSRKEFWHMLGRLKESGLTLLVSTAYMDEATLCDRVGLLQDGRLMGIDTPDAILNNFPWFLVSVRSANTYSLLTLLRESAQYKMVQPFGSAIHVSLPGEEDVKALDTLLNKNMHNEYKLEPINPGIEDCFMHLMTSQ